MLKQLNSRHSLSASHH